MIENRTFDLFEYQKSEKIEGLDFKDFENFLNKIWENRPVDGFFYSRDKENEKKSKGQRFFKLNYDDTITPRNYTGVVIYKDLSKNEVKEVIEIKPQDYIDNEKSFFHNNILLKKKSADKYCESKGVSYSFFTEKDAYSYLYTNKIVDKLYITFTKITNLARSYLNDNYDLYQKYKEIKGE